MHELAAEQIAALEQAVRIRIEQISVEARSEIMTAGISNEGRTFLARLLAVEALMTPLEMGRVEALLEHRSERRRLLDGSDDD